MTRFDRFVLKVLVGLIDNFPTYAQHLVDATGVDEDKIADSLVRLISQGYVEAVQDNPRITPHNYVLTDKGRAVKFQARRKPEFINTLLACANEIERLHQKYKGKIGGPNLEIAKRARAIVAKVT